MKTMMLELWVARRGLDPAAESCLTALRDLLRTPVRDVERGELWRFHIEASEDADKAHADKAHADKATDANKATLRTRLQEAACRAGRYVNTNRDVFAWLDGPRPVAPCDAPGCFAADVWVRDGDGRDPAALAWFRAQAAPSLATVERGVLWRLVLPADTADAAREAALEIALARGRHQGLLANPHAQRAEVIDIVPVPVRGEVAA
jgi:hypothetical protein